MSLTTSPDTFGADDPAWMAFADGCPNCGAKPHDAPEGVNAQGEPHWDNPHCFKCGFRFGTNTVSNKQQMYDAFKRFMASQPDYQHPTLNPPANDAEAADLRRQLEDAMSQLAALRPGADAVTTPGQQAFTPSTNPSVPDQPASQQAGMFAAPAPMGEQTGQVPPPAGNQPS